MRTMNPALNDSTFEKAVADWAPPSGQPHLVDDRDRMTFSGTLTATAVCLAVLAAAAFVGWTSVDQDPFGNPSFPGWLFIALIGGLGVAILTVFKPAFARFTAPLYAGIQGLVVGAISAVYNTAYDGIVLQAVGATLAVFAGAGGLGVEIYQNITFTTNIIIAGGIAILMALLFDLILLGVQRHFTPWKRAVQ